MNQSNSLDKINSERVEHALGQIHGLTAALMAVISTHPDAVTLLKHLKAARAGVQKNIQPGASAHFLNGLNDTMDRLETAATLPDRIA